MFIQSSAEIKNVYNSITDPTDMVLDKAQGIFTLAYIKSTKFSHGKVL